MLQKNKRKVNQQAELSVDIVMHYNLTQMRNRRKVILNKLKKLLHHTFKTAPNFICIYYITFSLQMLNSATVNISVFQNYVTCLLNLIFLRRRYLMYNEQIFNFIDYFFFIAKMVYLSHIRLKFLVYLNGSHIFMFLLNRIPMYHFFPKFNLTTKLFTNETSRLLKI